MSQINWAPLLHQTLQHHAPHNSNDSSQPEPIQPMRPEDKQWLSEAMESAATNHVKRIKTLMERARREWRDGESKGEKENEGMGNEGDGTNLN